MPRGVTAAAGTTPARGLPSTTNHSSTASTASTASDTGIATTRPTYRTCVGESRRSAGGNNRNDTLTDHYPATRPAPTP